MNLVRTTLLTLIFFSPLLGQAQYALTPAAPLDVGAPPAPGSAEFAADFTELHRLQNTRTAQDCATAELQTWFDARSISGVTGGLLSEAEFKIIEPIANQLLDTAQVESDSLKAKYNRARPYLTDPTLSPCITKPKKNDRAYPSGHALGGMLVSQVMALLFPARATEFQVWGKQVGVNRLVGGVHHPSDVAAGWRLSDMILAELKQHPGFLAEFIQAVTALGPACNQGLKPLQP